MENSGEEMAAVGEVKKPFLEEGGEPFICSPQEKKEKWKVRGNFLFD